jgi:acyl-CoA reductase-like NAD-dependent aldehyde dehydrogenase
LDQLFALHHPRVALASFIEPTVVTDATPDMHRAKEENFGTFVPLFMFKT